MLVTVLLSVTIWNLIRYNVEFASFFYTDQKTLSPEVK